MTVDVATMVGGLLAGVLLGVIVWAVGLVLDVWGR